MKVWLPVNLFQEVQDVWERKKDAEELEKEHKVDNRMGCSQTCVFTHEKKQEWHFFPSTSANLMFFLLFWKKSPCCISQGRMWNPTITEKKKKKRWKLGKKTWEGWTENTTTVFSCLFLILYCLLILPLPQTGLTPIYLWCLTSFYFIFPFIALRRLHWLKACLFLYLIYIYIFYIFISIYIYPYLYQMYI